MVKRLLISRTARQVEPRTGTSREQERTDFFLMKHKQTGRQCCRVLLTNAHGAFKIGGAGYSHLNIKLPAPASVLLQANVKTVSQSKISSCLMLEERVLTESSLFILEKLRGGISYNKNAKIFYLASQKIAELPFLASNRAENSSN